MTYPIHIVAIGARTPVGLTAESTAAAVRSGLAWIEAHPFIVDVRGEPVLMARDGLLDAGLFGPERMLTLARSALAEVVAKLSAKTTLRGEVPLLVGLPEPRPGFTEADARSLVSELARTAEAPVKWLARPLLQGHASALEALRQACLLMQEKGQDLCIVGGVDSYLHPDTLLWLDGRGKLAARGVRCGFPPGEGAGFVAVVADWVRRNLGLPSLGVVRAVHTARETKLDGTDALNLGEGLTEAIRMATSEGCERDELVDAVYCDLNGERYRSEEWGFAALRCQDVFRDPSPRPNGVAAWGDAGAASGALLMVLAVQAWQRGYARGPRALVCAGSDGGLRAAAVLGQQESKTGRK